MTSLPVNRLVWASTTVDDRRSSYGVGGQGPSVIFVPGWGLGHRAYSAALAQMIELGARVYAPALPGFAAAPELGGPASLADYARWLHKFLESINVCGPVVLVGHSFGGGVAIQFAHDFPGRVRSLVLVNSVGGPVWSASTTGLQLLVDRPIWDWAVGLGLEAFSFSFLRTRRMVLAAWEGALTSLVRNPQGLWRSSQLARGLDLTAQLRALRRRPMGIVSLWANADRVIPRASVDAMARAAGIKTSVVAGNHAWPLLEPAAFAAAVGAVLDGEATPGAIDLTTLPTAPERRCLKQPAAPLAGDHCRTATA